MGETGVKKGLGEECICIDCIIRSHTGALGLARGEGTVQQVVAHLVVHLQVGGVHLPQKMDT